MLDTKSSPENFSEEIKDSKQEATSDEPKKEKTTDSSDELDDEIPF